MKVGIIKEFGIPTQVKVLKKYVGFVRLSFMLNEETKSTVQKNVYGRIKPRHIIYADLRLIQTI